MSGAWFWKLECDRQSRSAAYFHMVKLISLASPATTRRGRWCASHLPCGGEALLPSSFHRASTVSPINQMRPLIIPIASPKSLYRAIPCKPRKSPVTLLFLGHSNVKQEKEWEIISLCWGRRQHLTVVLNKLKKLSKHTEWKSRECIKGFLRTLLYYICKKNKCRSNFDFFDEALSWHQVGQYVFWRTTIVEAHSWL